DLSVRSGEEDRHTTTRIVIDDVELPRLMGPESDHPASPQKDRADWFSAGDGEVDWPAFASPRRRRERDREPSKDRVRYLFPVPGAPHSSVAEVLCHGKQRS